MDIIDKLVELHGEDGLSPTRQDWKAIFAIQGSVKILNLLVFDEVDGLGSYLAYSSQVSSVFQRHGGKLVYFGKSAHIFGNIPSEEWDAAILTHYPSAQALANFWLDEEFEDAHKNRVDGVKKSTVIVLEDMG